VGQAYTNDQPGNKEHQRKNVRSKDPKRKRGKKKKKAPMKKYGASHSKHQMIEKARQKKFQNGVTTAYNEGNAGKGKTGCSRVSIETLSRKRINRAIKRLGHE